MKVKGILLLLLLTAKGLFACDCYEPTVEEALKRKKYLIFTGTILDENEETYQWKSDYDTSFVYTKHYKLHRVLVHDVYKGKIRNDTITIYTMDLLELGTKYIVYAHKIRLNTKSKKADGKKVLFASECCTRMRKYLEVEIAEMNKYVKPQKVKQKA